MQSNRSLRNKTIGVLVGLTTLGVSVWGQIDWNGSSRLFRVVQVETIAYHQLEIGGFAEIADELQDYYVYANFGLIEKFEVGVTQKWLGDDSKVKPQGGDRQSIGNTLFHFKAHFSDETPNIPGFAMGMTVIVPSGEEEEYNDLGLTALLVSEKHLGNLAIYGNLAYTDHNIDSVGYHVGLSYEFNQIFTLVEEINGLHTGKERPEGEDNAENNTLYVTMGGLVRPVERLLLRLAVGAKLLEEDRNAFRCSASISWRFF